MLAFLLPLASKIIKDAVARIPDNEELGEKMVEICLVILKKAVTLTETDMDDKLLAVVEQAIQSATETATMILRIDDVISSKGVSEQGMMDGMDDFHM